MGRLNPEEICIAESVPRSYLQFHLSPHFSDTYEHPYHTLEGLKVNSARVRIAEEHICMEVYISFSGFRHLIFFLGYVYWNLC